MGLFGNRARGRNVEPEKKVKEQPYDIIPYPYESGMYIQRCDLEELERLKKGEPWVGKIATLFGPERYNEFKLYNAPDQFIAPCAERRFLSDKKLAELPAQALAAARRNFSFGTELEDVRKWEDYEKEYEYIAKTDFLIAAAVVYTAALASARSDWARDELRSVMRRLMAFQWANNELDWKIYGVSGYDSEVEVTCREHEHLKEFGHYDHGKGEWVAYDVPRNLPGYDYNLPPVERKEKYTQVVAIVIERRGALITLDPPALTQDAVTHDAEARFIVAAAKAMGFGSYTGDPQAPFEVDIFRNAYSDEDLVKKFKVALEGEAGPLISGGPCAIVHRNFRDPRMLQCPGWDETIKILDEGTTGNLFFFEKSTASATLYASMEHFPAEKYRSRYSEPYDKVVFRRAVYDKPTRSFVHVEVRERISAEALETMDGIVYAETYKYRKVLKGPLAPPLSKSVLNPEVHSKLYPPAELKSHVEVVVTRDGAPDEVYWEADVPIEVEITEPKITSQDRANMRRVYKGKDCRYEDLGYFWQQPVTKISFSTNTSEKLEKLDAWMHSHPLIVYQEFPPGVDALKTCDIYFPELRFGELARKKVLSEEAVVDAYRERAALRDFAEGVFRGSRGPDDVEEMRSIYDRILAADAVAEKAVAGWKATAAAAVERGGEDAEEVARIEAAEEDVYRNFPEL